ncbi:MAG: hypothetical protein ABRQ37_28730 [Candidatus Eremiobacterota bacterium]
MKKLDLEICRKLREEGLTYQEIANYFDVSKQAVFDLLDKAGTPRKTKYSQFYEEWEELYRNGMGTHTIAEKYGCSRDAVHKHIKKKFVIDRGRKRNKKLDFSIMLNSNKNSLFGINDSL